MLWFKFPFAEGHKDWWCFDVASVSSTEISVSFSFLEQEGLTDSDVLPPGGDWGEELWCHNEPLKYTY